MKFKSKPVKVEQRPQLSVAASTTTTTAATTTTTTTPMESKPFILIPTEDGFSQSSSTASIVAAAVRSLSPLPPSGLVSMRLTSPLLHPPQNFLNIKPESELLSPAVSPPMSSLAFPARLLSSNGLGGNSNENRSEDDEDDEEMVDEFLQPVEQHQQQQQQQQQPQHFCAMCNKKFSRADLLRKHQKTHATSVCNVCGQVLSDKFALTKHQVEVHTMERVFQCPQCEKGFKEVRTLRLHLKIHNAEYPEQCGVCQKVFRTKWQLKQHQMDHGGERPYPCPECAFTCKTKQQLNEHRRKHSGEKAYSCLQCGTRFTYRNGLIKHTKLNRCPKKIVTADGETIIKKRSRTVSVKSKQNFGAPKFGLGSESWTDSPPQLGKSPGPDLSNVGDARKIGLVDQKLFEAVIRRHSDMNRGPVIADEYQVTGNSESSSTQFLLPQVGHGESGVAAMSFGLFDPSLCDAASSTTTTTTTSPTTTKVETTHQALVDGVLPDSTVTELSLATGLPESEIRSWATCLPAGSTVKVTHHFDTSVLAKAAACAANTVQTTQKTGSSRPGYGRIISSASKNQYHPHPESVSSVSSFTQPDLNVHDSLMGASVGLTPYQESFAVDPNEILRKDHARDFAASQSSHSTTSQFVPKFEPSDFIKEETNLSEDEDEDKMQQQQQQQQEQHQLFQAISNVGDFSSRYDNNRSNASSFNNSSYNNNNNDVINNNNQCPQMIHSANSRLLNCSLLLNFGKNSSTTSSAQSPSSRLIGGDPYKQTPSPASPINNSRRQNDLHLNVKLEPILSPAEPSSADSSFGQNFSSSPLGPLNLMTSPFSLTSPSSSSTSSSSYTPSSMTSSVHNGLLPDFDIDLPEMLEDVDFSGFAINDQDLTSIRAIVEQTFNDGRDVLDIISTVY